MSRTVEIADDDGVDNDDDSAIDERGETDSNVDDILVALYPEAGVHVWLNGQVRVTGFGRYMITSNGRETDDWMVGGQLTYFPRRMNR